MTARLAWWLVASWASVAWGLQRVLVTGAGGRTGSLVFEELKKSGDFDPIGLARSSKARKALKRKGASDSEIVSADVSDKASLVEAMKGCEAVVLCTSAVPRIKPWSIVKFIFKKSVLRKPDPGRPEFSFGKAGTPEEVDWLGAKNQIDAAVEAGVKKFVFVSSMGGTQPENFLNTIGRRPDGSGGDILLWKRKAERYLVAQPLTYTIIHPGGLIDEPGWQRELVVGVDDELLSLQSRSIPRADVARVCRAALASHSAANLSFDIATKPKDEGTPTIRAADVFATLDGKSCDYSTVLDDPPSVFQSPDL
mmetsp:Transcript_6153/g.18593  ORF Transcript_6153/g.18593 Transcript_6153/m.18593 type:complete len:309 (-) Transcript_6153:170-1096(-)|eukprot:CAMPEP_0197395542 /NCGR_PEP_ID=MMETSP1165-20131217/7138_1 /TAXON_ID=284809 /ORGANISM="Chrysocystis fragilis, Strain CCMP3189" /LENGTH=308 /DNA_ID=CAMNT_0042921307 /DNA_START=28 /DNA_END=954 /DNA_ORIENTATION=-